MQNLNILIRWKQNKYLIWSSPFPRGRYSHKYYTEETNTPMKQVESQIAMVLAGFSYSK